jgi:hypothetical protein
MRQKFMVLAIVLGAMLGFNYCSTEKKPAWPILSSYASLNDTVKYVGKETCQSCHADIYESFMHTGMGMSFDVATHKKSSAEFTHAVIFDKYRDFYYHPYWKDDSLHLLEYRLQGRDTIYRQDVTISYIIGSGQHTNSHIISTNGYLNQAPATFYTQKGEWHLPPGFEDGHNTRFSRIIGLECMSCHNSYPDFVMGSENKFRKVETGIGCERCHGPGEYHVQQKMSGLVVDTATAIDYSIVNPAKLSINLQLDVCQRCHLQGNAVLNSGKSFYDFKPGMKLSDVMNVFTPVYDGRSSEHIMASHVERLKQSRCFIETTRQVEQQKGFEKLLKPYSKALTCVTCHNPHVSVKVTEKEHFNNVCKNCHGPERTECTEKTEVRLAAADNCVSCHMPFSGTTDIPHVSVHDHKISIPHPELKQSEKVFKGIACINNPSADALTKARAFALYFEKFDFDKSVLDSALKYIPHNTVQQRSANATDLIHVWYLRSDFNSIASLLAENPDLLERYHSQSYSNSDAWTCYRIGAAMQGLNKLNEALKFYQRAVQLAPYHLDVLNKYAIVLSATGNVKEAKYYFEKILQEYPRHVSALTNLGFIYLSAYHDDKTAIGYYNKALQLDPDYQPALMNMAGVYVFQNKKKEAINVLEKVVKLDASNLQAKQLIQQLK